MDEESQKPQQDETPRFPGQQEERERDRVVAGDGVESGSIWGQHAALFGGERPRVQRNQQDESKTKQEVAGRRRRRCRWSRAVVQQRLGALAQTKAGLTTFRLGTVSWLECGPLAALVCSVQRPNVGSASPTTR